MDLVFTTTAICSGDGKRNCVRCNRLVDYTEEPMEDRHGKGWKQFCIHCGTCVGMRYEVKDNPPFVVNPYVNDRRQYWR